MNTPEDPRVQARLEFVQGSVVGCPRHLPCNYVNRLVGQRRIDDLFGLNEQESFTHPDGNLIAPDLAVRHHFYEPFELIVDRPWSVLAQPAARPGKGLLQAADVDRF